jgi:hypothetical protein
VLPDNGKSISMEEYRSGGNICFKLKRTFPLPFIFCELEGIITLGCCCVDGSQHDT